jgi:MFS transporter, DHA1 family, multidrug resistance protein
MTEKDWRHNRIIVLLTVALVFGGFTMVIAFLPFYLQELGIANIALNATYSGLLISIAPLLAAFTGPYWGRLADRRGLRRAAMAATLSFTVSWLIFGLATNVFHLIIARALGGLFGGINALTIPLAILGCPRDKIARTIGLVQSTRTASLALGPLAGGLLADWIGIRNTAYVAAALYLLAFLLMWTLFRESVPERLPGSSPNPIRIADILANPGLFPLFLVLFLSNFIERGFGPIIPLLVLELGAPPDNAAPITGAIVSMAALASTFASWGTGRMASRKDPTRLLRTMVLTSLAVSIPLIFCPSYLVMAVFRGILGFTSGGISTVAYLLADAHIPSGSRATGMGTLTSGMLLGNALGPLFMGSMGALGLQTSLGCVAAGYLALLWISWRRIMPVST